jgi:carboxylesterase type B
MRRFALAVALACLTAMPAWAEPQATIAQGALSGTHEGAISEFKGIPFAAPPTGLLRWRAPQPASGWQGVRDASAFGPICPQATRQGMVKLPQSEDCLTLNVWTRNAEAKLPVMVWIYGGSFTGGGSAFPIYDGLELAQHGVVVVTLNYRLGWLGFFDHPGLAAANPGEPTGNFGLLDQIAALEWVQKNIAAFGGDPANVTIFGESAGGMSVNDLMVSPRARGLFAKAISESGLGLWTIGTAAKAQQDAIAFAGLESADGASSDALTKLRTLSTEQILADQKKMASTASTAPFIDGSVLTDQPAALFSQGKEARVPYLAGSNSDEATLMPFIHMTNDDMLKPLGDLRSGWQPHRRPVCAAAVRRRAVCVGCARSCHVRNEARRACLCLSFRLCLRRPARPLRRCRPWRRNSVRVRVHRTFEGSELCAEDHVCFEQGQRHRGDDGRILDEFRENRKPERRGIAAMGPDDGGRARDTRRERRDEIDRGVSHAPARGYLCRLEQAHRLARAELSIIQKNRLITEPRRKKAEEGEKEGTVFARIRARPISSPCPPTSPWLRGATSLSALSLQSSANTNVLR